MKPESYKYANIKARILVPSLKELAPYFNDLKFEELKKDRRNPQKVTLIHFSFTPEDKSSNQIYIKGDTLDTLKEIEDK